MPQDNITIADRIRQEFSNAMSKMYRKEVPAYGTLIDLVKGINAVELARNQNLNETLSATDGIARISEERHGAIRLGTAQELNMTRRLFAIMGMYPVGYYDLSTSGIPVHSTAFRPVSKYALAYSPFRVFTSLLRLELIADDELRQKAQEILDNRQIFSPKAVILIEQAERLGLNEKEEITTFINEVLETFRWHTDANVSQEFYNELHDTHRLIADIVSFKGPHINHLTPRSLDIDTVQQLMPGRNITPKAVIEGPPKRQCPILLRQTSFKALEEKVRFTNQQQNLQLISRYDSPRDHHPTGSHTARFGEIEHRGIALTPKGMALYDALLAKTRAITTPAPDGSNATEYNQILTKIFKDFPDDWPEIRSKKLGYFAYSLTQKAKQLSASKQSLTHHANADIDTNADTLLDDFIEQGLIRYDPIIYEDFLPVSAAGIFQSNLGDDRLHNVMSKANQPLFEAALGQSVIDPFEHYAQIQSASIEQALGLLTP